MNAARVLVIVAAALLACTAAEHSAGASGPVSVAANPIVLVVDTSGSMGEDDGSGRIKIDGAKLALLNFLTQVESGTPIGLRTYPRAASSGCNSGTARFPIAPRDATTMAAAVRALEPDGDTPTAEAMKAAAQDLQSAGYTNATMVIVSDGESTCGSPCDAAKSIAASGISLQTITVGFRISSAGQQELKCIADATNGTYVDANDSSGLKDALAKVSRPSLNVELTYPTTVIAEAGSGAEGQVEVTAEITNTAEQTARNVIATMHFDGVSPGLAKPVVALGNLAAAEVRSVTWSFRPTTLLAGQTVSFTVSARADNSLSDAMSPGAVRVDDVAHADQAGPLLRGKTKLAIVGDSYSSGEGADVYIDGTDTELNKCHRSTLTYLMKAFSQPNSSLLACSGAVVNDMFVGNEGNHVAPQLDQLEQLVRTRGVEAVTMTLGGNNVLFSHLAISCLVGNCVSKVYPSFATPWRYKSGADFLDEMLTADLRDAITDVYADINGVVNSESARKARGTVAPILVPAYASPIPLTGRSCLAMLDQLTRGEVSLIGEFVTRLNGLVEAAVISARQRNVPVFFVPTTEDSFQPDHTVCDAHPYARGLTSVNGARIELPVLGGPQGALNAFEKSLNRGKQEVLHPNAQGYAAETNAIIRWTLTPEARVDAEWLKGPDAGNVPSLPIDTSQDQLGELGPRSAPTLQGGTTYPVAVGGFQAGSDVQLFVHSQTLLLTHVTVDSTGSAVARVLIPPSLEAGRHVLELRGAATLGDRSRVVRIPFTIAAKSPPLVLRVAEILGAGAGLIALLAWGAVRLAAGQRQRTPSSSAR